MKDAEPSDYKLLGLTPDATGQAIWHAHKRFSYLLHPDFNPDDDEAGGKFGAMNDAYHIICETRKRMGRPVQKEKESASTLALPPSLDEQANNIVERAKNDPGRFKIYLSELNELEQRAGGDVDFSMQKFLIITNVAYGLAEVSKELSYGLFILKMKALATLSDEYDKDLQIIMNAQIVEYIRRHIEKIERTPSIRMRIYQEIFAILASLKPQLLFDVIDVALDKLSNLPPPKATAPPSAAQTPAQK